MAQSSSASGTSSRRHLREHDASSPGSPRYAEGDWESKEAILHRELDEAKARAAQMEKTMRWWSDCTANWREKWCEVRDEKNKAKKEAKTLKSKLEAATKDLNIYKQESQELETQNTQLKKEMEKVHMILLKHAGQLDQQLISVLDSDPQLKSALGVDELLQVYDNIEQTGNLTPSSSKKEFNTCKSPPTPKDIVDGRNSLDKDIEEYILQGAVPKHAVEHKDTSPTPQEKRHSRIETVNEEALMQKMSALNLRLEEATKTISVEREENSSLHRGMEKLRMEVLSLRKRCEELQDSRTETMKELLELKGRFQGKLSAAQADLIDEATNREGMDKRLSELRAELEKLQAENADEWGKRERLETEKITLERQNKQMRNELRDLQDRVERRTRPVSSCDTDSKQLQQELQDCSKELVDLQLSYAKLKKMYAEKTAELSQASRRSEQYEAEAKRIRAKVEDLKEELALAQDEVDAAKELVDLKHSYAKLKKRLAEKTTELSHASRRSEQYESEVKRIRVRVEELKNELAVAQDEVDSANNTVRRLQRTNEDLTEQLENTNTQLEHYKNSISECRAPDVVAEIMDDKTRDENDVEEDEIAEGKYD